MKNSRRSLDSVGDIFRIRDSAFDRFDPRVLHPLGHARSHHAQILFTRVDQLANEMDAKKTSPASY